MYGTREAALNWQETLTEHFIGIGFAKGKMNPCIFHHASKGMRTVVHGDDYTSVGSPEAMRWLKSELEKKFEIKTTVLGNGEGR